MFINQKKLLDWSACHLLYNKSNQQNNGMKNLAITIFGFGILAFFIYAWYQYKLIDKIKVKFHSIRINEISKNIFETDVRITVLNPTDISITIQSYDFDIIIENTKIANVSWNGNVDVYSNSFSILPLTVSINPIDLIKSESLIDWFKFISNQNNVKIKVVGSLVVSFGIVSAKLPINLTY